MLCPCCARRPKGRLYSASCQLCRSTIAGIKALGRPCQDSILVQCLPRGFSLVSQSFSPRRMKRFDHRPEILGRFALERHALARAGMHESEDARVQHRARRFDLRTCVVADVDALSDQGMAELGQVDADLVLPAGFEAALDQGRPREWGDRLYVRDRTLRLGRNSAFGAPEVAVGAAESVAAIQHEM